MTTILLLTDGKKYYNIEEERWYSEYNLATPISGEEYGVADTDEFRWTVLTTYCPGPLTVLLDKQLDKEYTYPYALDNSARIDWENSSERKEKEQKRERQIVAKERAIELANLIKEDNGPTRDYGFELAELVLFLTT